MKLQLLVPHYKETHEEIEPLLDSIAIQQNVDFSEVGVVIAYDGPESEELPWVWFEKHWPSDNLGEYKEYPFEIKRVEQEEHVGVSATRNAALDAATADFVMFCDADDMFLSVNSLNQLFYMMDTQDFDTLVSCFMEEQKTADIKERMLKEQANAFANIPMMTGISPQKEMELPEFIYIPHEMDSTFVHGKVHRRSYLLDKGIRFDPDLTVHEDSYFNILAQNLANPERARYCPTPFYLWKWRDTSICRHDPDYILKTYNNMLDSNDALVDEFVRRMRDDLANFYTAFMIFDAYYTMNKPEWMEVNHQDYRDAVEKRFARYYGKHKAQWEKFTPAEKAQISANVRMRSVGEGMLMESITIDQWLERVESIEK